MGALIKTGAKIIGSGAASGLGTYIGHKILGK
ncbi:TPA: GatB family leaderless bacteriocin [Staphylococcus aureus]